jgi:hypothetical protein
MPKNLAPVRSLLTAAALGLGVSASGPARVAADPTRSWTPPHEADLPHGFPAPEEPGRVLVKRYPLGRGAFLRLEGNLRTATRRGFWPLFRHIRREGIEMTAPVLSRYGDDVRHAERGGMDMAFLYPSPDLGSAGEADDEGVRVLDLPAVTVVSVGVVGSYDLASLRAALRTLDLWLAEHAGTWRVAGTPRRLSYQQPLPFKRLYSEVQIPIAPAPPPR